jgi:triacylglycerol lipase
MSKDTIVLAHGLFGFGELVPSFQRLNYFNQVADLLSQPDSKFNAIAPQVDPIGSVQVRGDALADEIRQKAGAEGRLHIIAHSMGGLDARHVIARCPDVAARIATLVTIGTPHSGSPVADAIVNGTSSLFGSLTKLLPAKLTSQTDAIRNLTTEFCTQFNQTTPDSGTVRYINVAGDASRTDSELPFFKLAAKIGKISGEVNDGVVTRSSALRGGNEHLPDWPLDHLGEIGWSLTTVSVDQARRKAALQEHLDRYRAIIKLL